MYTAKLAAGALALALLAITPSSPTGAAPGIAPEPATASGSKASGITLVRQGGGRGFSSGGGNRGFSSGGNRGFSSRGFSSGGNRAFSSRGSSHRLGGSNRAMRFDGGGSRRFARSHGVPRPGFNVNPRYDRGHHHHHHRKHRHRHRFPGIAIYGAPYYADTYVADFLGDDCEELYHRAVNTNSRYWWNLYYDCRDSD